MSESQKNQPIVDLSSVATDPEKFAPIPTLQNATLSNGTETIETSGVTVGIEENKPISETPPVTDSTSQDAALSSTAVEPDAELEEITTSSFNSTGVPQEANISETESTPIFTSGVFTVGDRGEVKINFLYDGGFYKSEVGIFSIQGLEDYLVEKSSLFQEVARRVLSNSQEFGYVVISDSTEAAQFSGILGAEPQNWNSGINEGTKTFPMQPGEKFVIIVVPNGTIQEVFNNPNIGANKHPILSIVTENPKDIFHGRQFADVTGDGSVFAIENLRLEVWSDKDYNDIIFQLEGATGSAILLDEVIAPVKDWRRSELGQELVAIAISHTSNDTAPPVIIADNVSGSPLAPTIAGTVTDTSSITSFRAGFNDTQRESFIDITDALKEDGSFSLNRAILEAIKGGELSEGQNFFHLEAVDEWGNISNIVDVEFLFEEESNPPVPINLGRAAQFIGNDTSGNLHVEETNQYTFNLMESEINSTVAKKVLVGVTVQNNR